MRSQSTCSIAECARPAICHSWCSMHWQRWRKHGNPTTTSVFRPAGNPEARFWARVDKSGSCWEWQGSRTPQGYGRMRFGAQCLFTHRIAYVMAHGPIPDDMFVCHRCDNPPCVRIDHLFLGSHADNMADMAAKNRSTRNERSAMATVSDADVATIRALWATGQWRQRELGAMFFVAPQHISRIVLNQRRLA